jgi:hypothetical protein
MKEKRCTEKGNESKKVRSHDAATPNACPNSYTRNI